MPAFGFRSVHSRSLTLAVAGLLVTVVAAESHAEPRANKSDAAAAVGRCVAASEEGQRLRDEGKLSAAREQFLACSAGGCPSVIAKDCVTWMEDLERSMSSVSFRAKDEHGQEVLDVRVFVNDAKVSDSIAATSTVLDPGAYNIRFEREGGGVAEGKIVLRRGEKDRVVELTFGAPPKDESVAPPPVVAEPPPPPVVTSSSFQIPVLGWVGAGLFVAGAGTAAFFAVSANGDADDLRGSCAPRCNPSDRDAIESKILLANIGAGVAIAGAALAVTTTILANSHRESSAPPKTAKSGPSVFVSPVGIAGRF